MRDDGIWRELVGQQVTSVDEKTENEARRTPLVERAVERMEESGWSFAAFDSQVALERQPDEAQPEPEIFASEQDPDVAFPPAAEPGQGPRIILLSSEKGGTGKSTTAMHLIVALMKFGYTVGAIDLDARQATLSHYLENRRAFAKRTGQGLTLPLYRRVEGSTATAQAAKDLDDRKRLAGTFGAMAHCDFIVIDTPGSDTFLARLAHLHADVVVTPLNDSFLDVDVLAEVDLENREVLAPGIYTKLIRRQNAHRAGLGRPPLRWIVVRNRLTHINDRNKIEVAELLAQLAKHFNFQLTPGFGERVIFRELFREGRTLLDAPEEAAAESATSSHLSAYWEILTLLDAIGFFSGMSSAERNRSSAA